MGKRARWTLGGIVLLSVIGFGGAKLRREHEPIARWPLPDGTELRLEYVTYGTHHVIPGAGKLAELFSKNANRLPHANFTNYKAEYAHDTDVVCPVVWLTCRDPRRREFVRTPEIKPYLIVSDYFREGSTLEQNFLPPRPNSFYVVPTYNRRKPVFRMRMKVQGETFDIDVPNPMAGAVFSEWQPEPLPQTRNVGKYQIILRSLKLINNSPDGDDEWLIKPRLEVLDEGRERSDIRIRLNLLDTTGNSEHSEAFVRALPLSEPAWKLRVALRGTGRLLEEPETVEFLVAPPKLPEPSP